MVGKYCEADHKPTFASTTALQENWTFRELSWFVSAKQGKWIQFLISCSVKPEGSTSQELLHNTFIVPMKPLEQ